MLDRTVGCGMAQRMVWLPFLDVEYCGHYEANNDQWGIVMASIIYHSMGPEQLVLSTQLFSSV